MSANLPYTQPDLDESDIDALVQVVRSGWIGGGGPQTQRFETAFAAFTGTSQAVALSSGTAALHAIMIELGIGPGDEVIVPAITFAATANAVLYQGGTPVFADVDADTLLISPAEVAAKLTPRTKAIVAMDYAGQACDYDCLGQIARKHGVALVADACHGLGGAYKGKPVGSLADFTAFSFHPTKAITTGEGGMVTTDDLAAAERLRSIRSHGIIYAASAGIRGRMKSLGYNYRMSDLAAALGVSQLSKLPDWIARRRRLAALYDTALQSVPGVAPLQRIAESDHAYHLYVVKIGSLAGLGRDAAFDQMRAAGIGVQVHYPPVYDHPYYGSIFDAARPTCPAADEAAQQILSLPLFPAMQPDDVERVIGALIALAEAA